MIRCQGRESPCDLGRCVLIRLWAQNSLESPGPSVPGVISFQGMVQSELEKRFLSESGDETKVHLSLPAVKDL